MDYKEKKAEITKPSQTRPEEEKGGVSAYRHSNTRNSHSRKRGRKGIRQEATHTSKTPPDHCSDKKKEEG